MPLSSRQSEALPDLGNHPAMEPAKKLTGSSRKLQRGLIRVPTESGPNKRANPSPAQAREMTGPLKILLRLQTDILPTSTAPQTKRLLPGVHRC